MPEQPNRAHYHDDGDPLAEMERIVTESVGPARSGPRFHDDAVTGQRREAHDPRDFPRRDTSWRDPQVRTTVRAGLTPQPMPNQLADLEAFLSSDEPLSRLDATTPQYTDNRQRQTSNAQTGPQMNGQVRGNAIGREHMPDDEVTLPMHAVLKGGQPRPPALDPRAPVQPDHFNAYGHDAYAPQDAHAAHDPAGALSGTHYAEYTQEEAAFYADEAQGEAHNPAYYAPHYDDGYDDDYAPQPAPARRSSSSPLLFGGAIAAALLVVGAGGFYTYRSFSRAEVAGSGIPLIHADTKPVKEIAPPSAPTQLATGPNLNVARDGQDKLVSQTEDPVDKIPVKPTVRIVGTQQTTLAPVQRVHSVIVRPDGTFVSPETTASTGSTPPSAPAPINVVRTAATTTSDVPAPVPESLKPLPPLSPPTQIATAPVAAPVAQPKPVVPTPPVQQPVAAARPIPVAPVPAPPPSPNAPKLARPEPTAPLALGPGPTPQQPVRVANAPQATASSQHPATVEGASGEFMVQISSARSDAEARHALQSAVQKYAGLGVHGGDVQPADLGARGVYYRARLSGGSREQAAQLCQQIKAQGGDCVVAKR